MASYAERYAAQIAVLGEDGQERLRQARVHIAGFGGLGNLVAFLLATAGVGTVSANDPQVLETDNLGRFVFGTAADLGMPKVEVAARALRHRPDFCFEPLVAPTESDRVEPYFSKADWIVSASNTVRSRLACVRKALACGKPILDLAVADGRGVFLGTVKYRLPQCAWAACPACYFEPDIEFARNEGLLLPILSVTASIAAHLLVQFIAGINVKRLESVNFFTLELGPAYCMDMLAVAKRDSCAVCGGAGGYG
jgi:adenylyltransferase/sulfurtransferase